jgi:hypothetical protein
MRLLTDATPPAIRWVLAISALALGSLGWNAVIQQARPVDALSLFGALLLLGAAFFALAVVRTPSRPHAPLRVSLVLGAAFTALMIALTPAGQASAFGYAILLAVVLFILSAGAFMSSRPRLAFGLLIASCVLSLPFAISAVVWLLSLPADSTSKLGVYFNFAAFFAALASLWHGRALIATSVPSHSTKELR